MSGKRTDIDCVRYRIVAECGDELPKTLETEIVGPSTKVRNQRAIDRGSALFPDADRLTVTPISEGA